MIRRRFARAVAAGLVVLASWIAPAPVGAAGIVTKLARPGGHLTGISSLTTELVPKRLEALTRLVPTVRRVWSIYHADDPTSVAAGRKAEDGARQLGLALVGRPVRTPEQLERVLQEIRPGDALLPHLMLASWSAVMTA